MTNEQFAEAIKYGFESGFQLRPLLGVEIAGYVLTPDSLDTYEKNNSYNPRCFKSLIIIVLSPSTQPSIFYSYSNPTRSSLRLRDVDINQGTRDRDKKEFSFFFSNHVHK